MLKGNKSREFVHPIHHIRRLKLQTSPAISHIGEPTYFQAIKHDKLSHYRTEFGPKNQNSNGQRPTSPNRRNNPHPKEVYHLKRLRSGLVCDVRTKSAEAEREKVTADTDILGISKRPHHSAKEVQFHSWTKSVYLPYDIDKNFQGAKIARSSRQFPAIGIVPTTFLKRPSYKPQEQPDSILNDDHWLPGEFVTITLAV